MARTRAGRNSQSGFLPKGSIALDFKLTRLLKSYPEIRWLTFAIVSLVILIPLLIIFWGTLLQAFGITMAPAAFGIVISGIVLYKHPSSLIHKLNIWLSVFTLAVLTFGCMAFFRTADGILEDATMGGDVGVAIIGSQNFLGVLRLIGIGLLTIYLFRPKLAWKGTALFLVYLIKGLVLGVESMAAVITRIRDWNDTRKAKGLVDSLNKLNIPARQVADIWARRNSQLLNIPGPNRFDNPITPITLASQDVGLLDPSDEVSIAGYEEPLLSIMDVAPTPSDPSKPKAQGRHVSKIPQDLGSATPSMNILETTTEVELTPADNQSRAEMIEEALASHGIEVKVSQINPGPTVTQFGVEPGWFRKYKEVKERDEDGKIKLGEKGEQITRREEVSKKRVKVDQIAVLDKDLALALAAPSIRIEAPVPGKALVGIEVPNASMGLVGLKEALECPEFIKAHAKSNLAVALGKGSAGQMIAGDLSAMPHLLIAGATGSGKSICITSLISCLLMNNTPDDVKMVLIDPKRVELVNFGILPHLVTPVIVDMDKVVGALKWVCQEMDKRYKVMASAAARNITGYNNKVPKADLMPYLVVVIDELADLMSMAPFDVEQSLTRLAQMGRATGIHLIVATQRPSVDVITGLIKANFPTRISFAVTSMMDSRVILDTAGAEKLLGRGDMLYLPSDAPKPKRLQGVYVSEQEVDRIVNFWSERGGGLPDLPTIQELLADNQDPVQTFAESETQESHAPILSNVMQEIHNNEDPMFTKARSMARSHSRVSASLLQRKLGIGYPKAAALLDELEENGVVSAGEPGKSREVIRPGSDDYDD